MLRREARKKEPAIHRLLAPENGHAKNGEKHSSQEILYRILVASMCFPPSYAHSDFEIYLYI
nr:MAG TPA: hypothetical protein [Caudoviricetes sp.]